MTKDIGTYEWLDRALNGDPVWDLGQLSKLDQGVLDQAVHAGQLLKARARWQFISPLKTVWYRADNPPQPVMAQEYAAQEVSA